MKITKVFVCTVTISFSYAADVVVAYGESTIEFCEIDPSKYGIEYPKYYISKTEITNKQYYDYITLTKQTKDDREILNIVERRRQSGSYSTGDISYWIDDKDLVWIDGKYPKMADKIPVTLITLIDATKYADWVNVISKNGLARLPTWNEWMIAAYGAQRKYPWGDEWDAKRIVSSHGKEFQDRLVRPREVGSIPENGSPEGVLDLLGNVSEYLCIGDSQGANYFNLGARWMGGNYGDGYAFGIDKNNSIIKPRNDYWGYSHHAEMRVSGVGIRLLIDPLSDKKLVTMDRIFKQNNKAWATDAEKND